MSSLRRDAVRVVVPATSANLGPGFDSAGLALGLVDELVAMASDDPGVLVEVSGEGEDSVPRDESNLVVQCMQLAFDWLGVRPAGFVLRCANRIPHGRGLGSSAAAIIGGLALGRAMVDDGAERMTDADLLQLALTRESHPDNLCAALFGGFTVAWLEDDGLGDCIRMDVHSDVRPVVLVPSTSLPTAKARAVLPVEVPLVDAASNLARYALLVHALTTDPSRLMTATGDRLHQQQRGGVYPDSVALVSRLRDAGIPAVISGAGPTVLALCDLQSAGHIEGMAPGDWRVLPLAVSPAGARSLPL
jgi:homoserine kinase